MPLLFDKKRLRGLPQYKNAEPVRKVTYHHNYIKTEGQAPLQLKPTQALTLREEQPTHGVIQSFTRMQSISGCSLKTRGNSALSCLKNAKKISVTNIP